MNVAGRRLVYLNGASAAHCSSSFSSHSSNRLLLGLDCFPISSSNPLRSNRSLSFSDSISMATSNSSSNSSFTRIAVVGDVHDDWDFLEDSRALQFLQPDLVLFTGDFGNENVELVRRIADVKIAKAIILGNHDSWRTSEFARKRKDNVQLQLECLGESHVGYKRLDFPILKLSVVGGRPFSCGGNQLFRKKLLMARYAVQDMDGSSSRIFRAAAGAPQDHLLIFLAHNGPTGLGSRMEDICGRDWVYGGGDHGDPDLAHAIRQVKESGKHSIPLVVFGHMHKQLAYEGFRNMISIGPDHTVYLNGAIVPRVKKLIHQSGTSSIGVDEKASGSGSGSDGTARAFTIVELLDGKVTKIAETWVSVFGDRVSLEEEKLLFQL